MKTAVVDVGGGMRGVYASGVLDRCLKENIQFDLCIGVSAGSANLASYLSGQMYYANYERGTTSLGNGTIRGFMLVLKDAFDCDYDTEIFVRLNTEGAAIYSEEYDAQIDEVESWLEDFAQQKADERYQRLKADGEEELYASRQQLLSQTQKNQLELEASRQQLSRAEGTIADGKAQLEIGKSQLISGKAQLQAQRPNGHKYD